MLINKKRLLASFLLATLFSIPIDALFALNAKVVEGSLYETRIPVAEAERVSNLLSKVPQWEKKTIIDVFALYLQPLTKADSKNDIDYNIRFINAYWGPIQNPFSKFIRPAKIFVFFENTSTIFYMAPIVQDASDKQYYVFAQSNTQPLLLSDWLEFIRRKSNSNILSINICNQYGSYPNDICSQQTYMQEIKDTYLARTQHGYATEAVSSHIPSAQRAEHSDWKSVLKNKQSLKMTFGDSIVSTAVPWSNVSEKAKVLNRSNAWRNYETINDNFKIIRDTRIFHDGNEKNFLRRLSWLYPDDGCWTRAAAAVKSFFGPLQNNQVVNHFSRPAKVFVFGNLCVNSPNSPKGAVSWWYHTAPIIRDQKTGESYVLDPAVDPKKPLLIATWIKNITSRDGACARNVAATDVRINVCEAYGVSPYDNCATADLNREARETIGQEDYLSHEKERQLVLGRDPHAVLGDTPPWIE